MKAFTYTNQHLGNMIDSLSFDPSIVSSYKHEVLKEYPTWCDFLYDVLTECVEDYEPLTVARDYTGEYDAVYSLFRSYARHAEIMPDLKTQDIRVVVVPLAPEYERIELLHDKNSGLGHTLDYPLSERNQPYGFAYITQQLVNMIEAHYFNHEKEKTTKHLLFARHHTGLCVFVH